MLVLFINAHKKNEEGAFRFRNFYENVQAALKRTIYYGNEVVETVRCFDDLQDYIYDEITFRIEERARRRFESLQYVFVDGNFNFAPWAEQMADVLHIVRSSIDSGKKIFCNGFAHFAAYYYLATRFDKHCVIATARTRTTLRNIDYDYNQESGDLSFKGKRVCNSGIRVLSGSRAFAQRSAHAVEKGVVVGSKFEYVVFDSKSGQRILRNIEVPFTFYWKSRLFCTSKAVTQVKVEVIFQTEDGHPLAFSYRNLLSTQGLCPQFLKLLGNWLLEFTQRQVDEGAVDSSTKFQSIAFENKTEFRKTLSSPLSLMKFSKSVCSKRPLSSKFSTVQFDKPAVRCSGKYETLEERYLHEKMEKKGLNFGRSRMIFKGKLSEMEIPNYVTKQPSRPASSHKYREVSKEKWVSKQNFFNC